MGYKPSMLLSIVTGCCCLGLLLFAACGTPPQGSASTTVPVPQGTATATPAPGGPVVLGGLASAFAAKYGPPNDHSVTWDGQLHFARYAGSNTDQVIVQLDQIDGPALSQRVVAVFVQSPPDRPWGTSMATTTCTAFAPHDATLVQRATVTGPAGPANVDVVYYSATLAATFPAQAFLDPSQYLAPPGSFDIFYLAPSASDASHVSSCQLLLGTTQTQA